MATVLVFGGNITSQKNPRAENVLSGVCPSRERKEEEGGGRDRNVSAKTHPLKGLLRGFQRPQA